MSTNEDARKAFEARVRRLQPSIKGGSELAMANRAGFALSIVEAYRAAPAAEAPARDDVLLWQDFCRSAAWRKATEYANESDAPAALYVAFRAGLETARAAAPAQPSGDSGEQLAARSSRARVVLAIELIDRIRSWPMNLEQGLAAQSAIAELQCALSGDVAAGQQAEPVAPAQWFQNTAPDGKPPKFEQVGAEFRNDPDVFPLYFGAPTPARGLTDEEIKSIFLANGFTIKEGLTDLKPYVYTAARAILAASGAPTDQPGEKG